MSILRKKLTALWNHYRIRSVAALLTFTILLVALPGITYATNVVYIHDGEDVYQFYTANSLITSEEILDREEIELSARDEVEFTGFDEDGIAELNIYRAFSLAITADGKTTYVTMTRGTVNDALERADVSLSDNDRINVSPYEDAVSGMEIVVNRVTFREKTKETAIPFEVETTENAAYSKGKTIVTQVGKEGKQVATFRETLVDGVVAKTDLISNEITVEPVNQKQIVGTNTHVIASDILPPTDFALDANGVPLNYSRVLTGKATAYSSRRYPNVKGASGQFLKCGSVAVDPRIIPYGTKLYIASPDGSVVYGYAIAGDTGGAMYSGEALVDLFFDTYDECIQFGRREMNIYILE